jgi:hypothetical protein
MAQSRLPLLAALLTFSACKAESERPAESQAPAPIESASSELGVGQAAPKVTLPLQDGKALSIADLKGKQRQRSDTPPVARSHRAKPRA